MYCCHIKLNHYSVSRVQSNFCLSVLSSEAVGNSDHLGLCRSGIGNCSGNNWLVKLLPLSGNYSLSVLLVFSHEPILEFIILQAIYLFIWVSQEQTRLPSLQGKAANTASHADTPLVIQEYHLVSPSLVSPSWPLLGGRTQPCHRLSPGPDPGAGRSIPGTTAIWI